MRTFEQWVLEARSLRNVNPEVRRMARDYYSGDWSDAAQTFEPDSNRPELKSLSPEQRRERRDLGESKDSRVRKDVLGWEVWFVNETWRGEDFARRVAEDEKTVYRVLATYQSFGLRKSMRVPIVIAYTPEGGVGGVYNFGVKYRMSGKEVDGAGSVVRRNVKDTAMVHVEAPVDGTGGALADTLAHEIAHLVYSTLSPSQQFSIQKLAHTTPSASAYGMPSDEMMSSPGEHHLSGNEWFAEMVALVLFKVRTGGSSVALRLLGGEARKVLASAPRGWVAGAWRKLLGIVGRNEEVDFDGVRLPSGKVADSEAVSSQGDAARVWGRGNVAGLGGFIGNDVAPQPNQSPHLTPGGYFVRK